ncbi:MAG TPA: hypothetical protein PKE29_17950 [Phycisphaerales bacterium]|nr:hypothetical protein [Phycisphaerales bacterium]
MKPAIIAAASAVAVSGASFTQARVVEFRIVERTGQTVANPADPVLDFAVQARVIGGTLAGFSIETLTILGEPDSYGTLARGIISELDGTYSSAIGVSATVGRAGLARQFTYVAGINSSFNGLINTSGGTFSNGPNQEIGIISASAAGSALLGTPGIDDDGDGNPDGWSGNGLPAPPTNGTLVPIPTAIAQEYFASGQFIDVYRFRYTVANFSSRVLAFSTNDVTTITSVGSMIFNNGLWGAYGVSESSVATTQTLQIAVVPGPGGAAILCLAGVRLFARRRR